MILAPTNELTGAGNVLKFIHIEHCRLPHTLSNTKKQELEEKRCVLWPAVRRYGMSANPVSPSFTEQNRKKKKCDPFHTKSDAARNSGQAFW